MPVTKPYKRTYRQFSDGSYGETSNWRYITHPKYAVAPLHYLRAFNIVQKDLLHLFDYVEPGDNNMGCYSYRIHELLTRACIEVEANCKAILEENHYRGDCQLTMRDYSKLESSHRLSEFHVRFPIWEGQSAVRRPFFAWSGKGSLDWYQAYNDTKHDRHANFSQANFGYLIDAVAGLLVILTAQFGGHEFSPIMHWTRNESEDGFRLGIGQYLYFKPPTNWPIEERYDFEWNTLASDNDPFQLLF